MLVDDPTARSPLVCIDTLPFLGATGSALAGIEKIDSWAFSREIATGQVALTSYDFERPSVSLAASSALERAHGLAALEQFDFDGSYTQLDDGRRWASDPIEELQSRHKRLAGTTNEPITAAQAVTLPVFGMSMRITGLCVATPTPLISYDYDYGPDYLLKTVTITNPEVKVNVLTYQQAHAECLHCRPGPTPASPPTRPQPRCPACCANTRSTPSTRGCKEACSSARRVSR